MKNRKPHRYDFELANSPVHTTLRRRPRGVRHMLSHRVMFLVWLAGGLLMAGLALAEWSSSKLYTTIILMASDEMQHAVGLDAQTIAGFATGALVKGKVIIVALQLFFAGFFFINAYYCRRLISRSRYILKLEKVALAESLNSVSEEAPVTAVAEKKREKREAEVSVEP